MEEFTSHQRLLMKIRDELCKGNSAELARKIKKDATYVNRLFYPIGKNGRKNIGLEIMGACNEAFHLPRGYWDGGLSTAHVEQGDLPTDVASLAMQLDLISDKDRRTKAFTLAGLAISKVIHGIEDQPTNKPDSLSPPAKESDTPQKKQVS